MSNPSTKFVPLFMVSVLGWIPAFAGMTPGCSRESGSPLHYGNKFT